MLTNGCLEYIDLDANLGVVGHSVYIGFRRGRLDLDTINGKETEELREIPDGRVMYYAEMELWLALDDPKQKGSCFSYYANKRTD